MVARDHLHRNARGLTLGHGGNGLGPWRVDDADKAHQGEALGYMGTLKRVRNVVDGAACEGKHPSAGCGLVGDGLLPVANI